MEVGGQSVGGQGGGWRSVCGKTGWKLEVSLWVDRVEVRGQSVGGQGGGWRSVCGWTGWKLEVSLWVDRVEVGGCEAFSVGLYGLPSGELHRLRLSWVTSICTSMNTDKSPPFQKFEQFINLTITK